MTNVPTEAGPYTNMYIPVGAGLQPHQFGYGPSPIPYPIREALSTGRALAGYAGTAIGQLEMLRSGVQPQLVIIPLA